MNPYCQQQLNYLYNMYNLLNYIQYTVDSLGRIQQIRKSGLPVAEAKSQSVQFF